MMNTPTPKTDARWDRLWRSGQSWYQIAEEMKLDCRQLESELTAVTEQRDRLLEQQEQWRLSSVCRDLIEQRDEARKLAEKYRYLSCDSQEEADATLLPWENNQPTEL